jgi:hypothetical protein
MKLLISFVFASYLLTACAAVPSTDTSESPTPTDAGPAQCPDGTPPPCTIRN